MVTIIGVKFGGAGKLYYFDPEDKDIRKGMSVVVETSRGQELGSVVVGRSEVADDEVVSPLKPVIRIASEEDFAAIEEHKAKEKEAFRICKEKIQDHKLDMKLVKVEYTFDNSKILFYFTADGRIDFRELVKDLASVFRMRIELRQIGVRDETKMHGGIGICGRPLCCSSYLNDFVPVSIKMAKEQNLSLNPTKISGVCGRLMCCLKNEEDTYEYLNDRLPRVGDRAMSAETGEKGQVASVNVLRQMVRILVEEGDTLEAKDFPVDELKFKPRHRRGGQDEPQEETITDWSFLNPDPLPEGHERHFERRPRHEALFANKNHGNKDEDTDEKKNHNFAALDYSKDKSGDEAPEAAESRDNNQVMTAGEERRGRNRQNRGDSRRGRDNRQEMRREKTAGEGEENQNRSGRSDRQGGGRENRERREGRGGRFDRQGGNRQARDRRTDAAERQGRDGRTDAAERQGRDGRTDAAERQGRDGRTDVMERQGRMESPENGERSERGVRPERRNPRGRSEIRDGAFSDSNGENRKRRRGRGRSDEHGGENRDSREFAGGESAAEGREGKNRPGQEGGSRRNRPKNRGERKNRSEVGPADGQSKSAE